MTQSGVFDNNDNPSSPAPKKGRLDQVDSASRAVIIAAGGSGTRMGHDQPKQMLPLSGVPVIARVVQCFQACDLIDSIVIVAFDSTIDYLEKECTKGENFSKVKAVVQGAEERPGSVWQGLQAVDSADLVLVHDGARPFVRQSLIERAVEAGELWSAAIPVLPCSDTIKEVGKQGVVERTVDRSLLRRVQTPQVFRYDLLRSVYESCRARGLSGTDDASLCEICGHRVYTFAGDEINIKLTWPEDMRLAEFLAVDFPWS